ncbi:hypothetical protein M5D96_001923 [Drosophila gunungcola]|uniref:Uncharacterized protein n=1 Tax=Drosophila gunungcola TaxID=103775 RepID=A0A9Q0BVV8_9MUSC|nr:hypothetical protein M5D96_001923 [Drosophila gunungcola]
MSRICSPRRYEAEEAASPTRYASSASCVCRLFSSGSEKTATVRTPSLRAVLITRQAISPRFEIRILLMGRTFGMAAVAKHLRKNKKKLTRFM